ncbi:MAG: NAD kinase [Bacteroidaceae bacterium]|nr:NAD kinase [Bacteroidaceae bacterium]
MKFAIIGNTFQPKKCVQTAQLFNILRKKGAEIAVCKDFYEFLVRDLKMDIHADELFENRDFDADMVLSMGGDGTFLKTANRVGDKNIPILGINTGRLGFLADISPDEIEKAIDEIYTGKYRIENHCVLQLICNDERLQVNPFALNEIAVLKRDISSMITIYATVKGSYLNTYQADGLIIATPTGSTAYSLSVGGPIIVPNSQTIVITPVAPHSLNIRPIVICDDWEVTLDIESRNHNFLVAIDGRSESCKEGTKLTIRKANYSTKVVKRSSHTLFDTLRSKMMWGADNRNEK